MNAILGLGIIVVVVLLGIFLYLFFSKKGTPYLIEIYEPHQNKLIRLFADKKLIGRQYRDNDGIEVLKLDRKVSKYPIMACGAIHVVLTNSKMNIIRLVKRAEGIYEPLLAPVFNDNNQFADKVDARDAVGFYIQAHRQNEIDFAKKQHWLEKYGAVIGIVFLFIGFLAALWFVSDMTKEMTVECIGVVQDINQKNQDQADRLINIFSGLSGVSTQPSVEPSDTAELPLGQR